METSHPKLRLLLVDDEDDFRRATSRTLGRRGFVVTDAVCGEAALDCIRNDTFDIVVLDLNMPGLSGIETLQQLRDIEPRLPVIILTGHGDYETAMAGIKLEIVDFIQKPVDIDLLGRRIRKLLEGDDSAPLRERTIGELMIDPSIYPKIYIDEGAGTAVEALCQAFLQAVPEGNLAGQVRSALVYDREERFVQIIRFNDLLRLLLPPYLSDSPYASYFTGMFLAQCKVLGNRRVEELVGKQVSVEHDAPLMEAVHLLLEHDLINLPVMKDGRLAGILRGRDIILEVGGSLGSLKAI